MDLSAEPGIAADAVGNAAQALREPAVERLCALVREPSLLGAEASAQALMREHFARLGLRIDKFEVDEARLRDHPGWSPSIVPYAGRRNVVAGAVADPQRPHRCRAGGRRTPVARRHSSRWCRGGGSTAAVPAT